MDTAVAPAGEFARLLEAEGANDTRIRTARSEAEAIVASARESVATASAALAREIAAELDQIRAGFLTEQSGRIATIRDDVAREVQRLDANDAERIAPIVPSLIELLIGEEAP